MNQSYTKAERAYINRVKELPCSVCDTPGPSDAHHIKQSSPYTCVALCPDCHRNSKLGWHGERAAWKIRHMDEIDALDITIRRLHG